MMYRVQTRHPTYSLYGPRIQYHMRIKNWLSNSVPAVLSPQVFVDQVLLLFIVEIRYRSSLTAAFLCQKVLVQ